MTFATKIPEHDHHQICHLRKVHMLEEYESSVAKGGSVNADIQQYISKVKYAQNSLKLKPNNWKLKIAHMCHLTTMRNLENNEQSYQQHSGIHK